MRNDAIGLHELPLLAADRTPEAIALLDDENTLTYGELARRLACFAGALEKFGIRRGERVAVYLDKRIETVVASFAAPARGAVFVPINPLLKPEQVAYILRDCNVRLLVTSRERLQSLEPVLASCPDLGHVVVVGETTSGGHGAGPSIHGWHDALRVAPAIGAKVVDSDIASILYTSGSTGKPKGVVLSHRNMVAGAKSVASYLGNHSDDTLLAALPLSFDAGFSQLTTAFHVGARVVLLNYLLPKDVVTAIERHGVTGLTAVPPLWIQLAQSTWPDRSRSNLRYFANTGGRMPLETLNTLRALFAGAKPFLMYGLTEAFRATYLPPEEVDRRPDSIGKAIPNAEVLVLRPDGSPCQPNEPGELVQRGALVAQGYWNDEEKTAERFRPIPWREAGLRLPEVAVFSGDTVRMDEEGFIYFIGRVDEMIKSSGYRISPSEVEEVFYGTQLVGECAVFGIPHPTLGQAIAVVVTSREGQVLDMARLLAICKEKLPSFMVPALMEQRVGPLPRNANGKIDRKSIGEDFQRSKESQS